MPLEPLYSLAVACELIPVSGPTLASILHRHKEKFPARYNLDSHAGPGGPERMLLESECLAIRDMVIRPDRKAGLEDIGVLRKQIKPRTFQSLDGLRRYPAPRPRSEVDKFLLDEESA